MSGNSLETKLENRLRAIRAERAEVAVAHAELIARDEQLIREEVALRCEVEAKSDDPYSVGAQWIIRNNDISERAFWRTVQKAQVNGFPRPIHGFTSDPRWIWAEVKEWLSGASGRETSRKRGGLAE